MQDEVTAYLNRIGLKDSETLLVAVSGGVDSMVLLHLLLGAGVKVAVAHFNFKLRGEQSDKDEALVQSWCAEHEVTLYCQRADTAALVKDSGRSVQMVARELRYELFEQLAARHGHRFVALAHHADDRVESLILNLLRGTGVRGLQGMPSQRGMFIRPLLGYRKEVLLAFALAHGVPYREDASNADAKYLRNRVRLHLLPMLRQLMPDVDDYLQEFVERAELSMEDYQQWVKGEMRLLSEEIAGHLVIDRMTLRAHRFPFTVLREIIHPSGFSSDQVLECMRSPAVGKGQMESGTHILYMEPERLVVCDKVVMNTAPAFDMEVVPRSSVGGLQVPSHMMLSDAATLDISVLHVRKWRIGDRFRPYGMKGWKLVSDYLINAKFTAFEKETTWLVMSGENIVWVMGHRMDDRYKVTDSTTEVLRITLRPQ